MRRRALWLQLGHLLAGHRLLRVGLTGLPLPLHLQHGHLARIGTFRGWGARAVQGGGQPSAELASRVRLGVCCQSMGWARCL